MAEQFGFIPTEAPLLGLAIRLMLAGLFGAVLGIEREVRDRSAGLRTYTLTALAACLFTIVAIELSLTWTKDDRVVADPVRVVEAVTAGVAFLAAGTIISRGHRVVGLTTGAGMWAAGAIGMACGAGLYGPAVIACLLTVLVLTVLRRLETGISKTPRDRSPDET